MKIRKTTITIMATALALLVGASGCVVNKPDLNGLSSSDYNTRKKVTGAHYRKKLSVPGIILTAAAPVAGAVAGYNLNMVTIQKGAENKPIKPANAAIGAVVGYSMANLINYCVGLNKTTPANDPNKWLKSIDKRYVYVPNTKQNGTDFTIIEKSVEYNYKVKNLEDAKQFYGTFPYSSNKSKVFKQAIDVCSRPQLLELIALDGKNTYADEAKKKYILESPTYDDLASAHSKFSNISIDYENRYADLVKNIANAVDFHRRYPNSRLSKKVIWSAFTTDNPSKSDVNSLKNAFGKTANMSKSDLSVNPTDTQKRNFMRAMYQAANPKSETDLEILYRNYSWLTYGEKAKDIVSNVYQTAYSSFTNGNYLVYYMKELPKSSLYKSWGVTNAIVKEVLDNHMKNEANKIKIVSTNTKGSNNDDWQKWLRNTTYTAGIVAEQGEVKYLIYGVIENTSKFDMPVTITANADLMLQMNLKGKGILSGFLSLFGVSIEPGERTRQKINSRTGSFYIPSLKAHSKSSYAILMNFGAHGNQGVNVADWFKVIKEVYLDHVNVTTSVGDVKVSEQTLNTQQSWLYMAKNGLPDTPLTDLKRNERVDENVWAQRWVEESRRRQEAWERYQAESAKREAAEKRQKEIDKAVEQEMNNRKYTKKYHCDYDVIMPSGHVTEWNIYFGDGECGSIAYMDWNRKWYCHEKLSPAASPNAALSSWTQCNSESDAINTLYEMLHK